MTTVLKKIVIVGGGVGGLKLTTKLGRNLGRRKKATITLVDHNHSYLWKPRLHEVATGSFNEETNELSYMEHAHNHYFHFQLGSITNINRKTKTITLADLRNDKNELLIPERQLSYDILVMAIGSISNDFNIHGVKEHCIFLDSPKQARYLHKKMIDLFMQYSINQNSNNQINIAIVGGGATGVELSAELHNTVKQLRHYGYNKLTNNTLYVTLIEASDRILPGLPLYISNVTRNELKKLGVRVLTNIMVTSADESGFYTKNGEYIKADLMIWAAGIKIPDFIKNIGGLETNHINQLVVTSTLQTTRDSNIFVIGDCAACPCLSERSGIVPPRAQAAHQMADIVLHNILADIKGKTLKSYVYRNYGSLISLSDYSTVGILMGNLICNSIKVEGWIARLCYIFLYRMHQVVLYGYFKTILLIIVSVINRIVHPSIKLH